MYLLLGLLLLLAGVIAALSVLQQRWDLDSVAQAAGECVSRVVPTPLRTGGSLRRRLTRSVVRQKVMMPSGEIQAARHLHVRVAAEDVDRLAPNADLDDIAADTASLYLRHAQRQGWRIMAVPSVSITVDPVLRSGWIPAARVLRDCPSDVDAYGLAVEEAAGSLAETWGVPDEGTFELDPADAAQLDPAPEPDDPEGPPETRLFNRPHQIADDVTQRVGFAEPYQPRLQLRHVETDEVLDLDHSPIKVGRNPDCQVKLSDPGVSREHATLTFHSGSWWLRDMASRNGTYLDRHRVPVHEEVALLDRAEIRFASRGPAFEIRTGQSAVSGAPVTSALPRRASSPPLY